MKTERTDRQQLMMAQYRCLMRLLRYFHKTLTRSELMQVIRERDRLRDKEDSLIGWDVGSAL